LTVVIFKFTDGNAPVSIMKNLIINADDFGLKSSVNKAIIQSFDSKLINSTTLMANMPGFEEAVELAHKHKIANQIGAHLVLTEGLPLTEEIKCLPYLFNKKTNSTTLFIKNLFFLNKNEQTLIFKECCKQIEKIKNNGIAITHLDTHHQIHDMWAIFRIILELLRVYKIPFVRILNNLEKSEIHKNIYRNLINTKAKKLSINHTDYFGSRVDFMLKLKKNPNFIKTKTVEIMVHPDYNNNGDLVDLLHKKEYDLDFVKILNQ